MRSAETNGVAKQHVRVAARDASFRNWDRAADSRFTVDMPKPEPMPTKVDAPRPEPVRIPGGKAAGAAKPATAAVAATTTTATGGPVVATTVSATADLPMLTALGAAVLTGAKVANEEKPAASGTTAVDGTTEDDEPVVGAGTSEMPSVPQPLGQPMALEITPVATSPVASPPVATVTASPTVAAPPITATPVAATLAGTTPIAAMTIAANPAPETPVPETPAAAAPIAATPAVPMPIATTPAVATSIPVTPVATTPIAALPVAVTPSVTTPDATTPANATPIATTPVAATPTPVTPFATDGDGGSEDGQDRDLQSQAEDRPEAQQASGEATAPQVPTRPPISGPVPPVAGGSPKVMADTATAATGPVTGPAGGATAAMPGSASHPGLGQATASITADAAVGPAVDASGQASDISVAPVAGGFAALVDAWASPAPDGAAAAAPGPASAGSASSAVVGTAPAPAQHQGPPVPLGAVPMTIGLRSLAGSSHFEIRLDPVDLGRIDVSLDIDKDAGTVTTRLVVDRPETLALLQRDAGNLQEALSQAGLDPGAAGISLSLRGDGPADGRGSDGRNPDGRGGTGRPGAAASDPTAQPTSSDSVAPRMLHGIAGIDIRI